MEMRKREQELLAKIKEQQKELDTVKEEMIKELSGIKGSTILECKPFLPFRYLYIFNHKRIHHILL